MLLLYLCLPGNQPAERFEEDRTWSFSGAAFRMATDLNLHRKTIPNLPEDVSEETRVLYEREILNRKPFLPHLSFYFRKLIEFRDSLRREMLVLLLHL